ncbi:tetratricopeptide repeat protein [Methanobrevibacter arboriphilus]|uniref:tetratricopeptide repeat protein n=1 Tax=Methanobrevibacter arboriphilus TaxID=39441 RepID=UPI000A8D2872|nr:tetratricopeptide repeat protein [Methanobrevibacter arboriphilus]
MKPDDFDLLLNKADVLYKLNRFDDALNFYNKSLKLDPNNEYALKGHERVLKKIKNED